MMQQAGARFNPHPSLFCAYMPNATTAHSGRARTLPLLFVLKIQKNPPFLLCKEYKKINRIRYDI